MGRRSRRREADGESSPSVEVPASKTTRAQRDAARQRRRAAGIEPGKAPRRTRRPTDERPAPPWGNFPLSEIVIFIALVFFVLGLFVDGAQGQTLLLAALVLGSLAGLEIVYREHFGGYRSHSTLLAGAAATVIGFTMLFALQALDVSGVVLLLACLASWAAVFAFAFQALRQAFVRRSGGLGFR